ncbi:ESA_00282 family adhesion-associated protein [Mangrovibacter sp. MFB070]|uniref:DUF7943 domain-containing protein n=1 Tax=Mangrovibacter plantisponsor TaxID=451513 RepID=A0A317QAV6_9ENTR|nr:hypothetical protein [Mangrovibacter sp. MFB070]KEA53488.1 RNA helicase [Mangrovibacter sp. MFB070]PWW12915.1 hypothetical protein DES37_101492 [Mangrovibacter plantisponsor]
MSLTIYLVFILLILLGGVLVLMRDNKNSAKREQQQPLYSQPSLTPDQGEDQFARLINHITPPWYWRVNNEYIDFVRITVKQMGIDKITSTPGLFDAQRRCSDLNSAVYKYYDNLKKRCMNGEVIGYSDIEVLNLRQCFYEFSLSAYPELVAIVWPAYQRPMVSLGDV